jgi:SOS-response transcriptional repressor LexA
MADIKGKFPNGLAAAMKRKKIGSTKIGKLIGTSKQNVTRWANQSRALPAEWADEIAPILETTAAELLLVDASIRRIAASRPIDIPKAQAVRVPLVSWVSAGKFASQDGIRPADVKKYLVADLSSKGDWIALQVFGDSMDLVAREGAIIFVDRKDNERLRDNAFYVFVLEDGSTTFKRYRSGSPPKLQPYSRSPDHETQFASDGMKVIGRVKRVVLDL